MVKRIAVYLNEMFPVSSIVGSVLMAVAVQLIYLRLFDARPDSYFPLIVPGMVLTLISLLIRVMDEFKDYQDDLTNFPQRPLPSGRVKREDLIGLGIFCVIMVIFLSMTSMPLLIWSMITLGFTFLMLKWFFVESIMRKSLPLAFISHHPIVLFNFVYLMIACTQMNPAVNFDKAFYVLPLCFIFTNWEIERKIRSPELETSYTTYSKIMGPRPAILIAIVLQLIFNVTVMVIFDALRTMWVIRALFVVVELALMMPAFKFLITVKTGKPLKQYAELQILTIVGFLLLAALV